MQHTQCTTSVPDPIWEEVKEIRPDGVNLQDASAAIITQFVLEKRGDELDAETKHQAERLAAVIDDV